MTRQEFLRSVENWNNHLYLLWPALEATTGDIVEFGMGYGSTPILRKYAAMRDRHLTSYENNLEWFEKFPFQHSENHELIYVSDWDTVNQADIDVLLVDHAPGERRKIDIAKYANIAKIIVCHDTEPAADHGYQMRGELDKFKYQVDYQSPGAWASIVSNFVDVKKICGFA